MAERARFCTECGEAFTEGAKTRFYKIPVGLGQKLDVSGTVIARISGVRRRRRHPADAAEAAGMRRLAALVAFLALAAPASAQTQTTTTAGGSFNSAPVLESGTTSRDSVRLGEELFCGVKLAVGQKAKWQIRVLGAAPETLDNFGQLNLDLATPLRRNLVFDDDSDRFDGRTAASLQAETDTVVGEGVPDADSDVAVSAPTSRSCASPPCSARRPARACACTSSRSTSRSP